MKIKFTKKNIVIGGVVGLIILIGGTVLGNKIHCDIVLGMLKNGDIYASSLVKPKNKIEEIKVNYILDKYYEYEEQRIKAEKAEADNQKLLEKMAEEEYYRQNPEQLIEVIEKSLVGRELKVKVKNNSNKTTSYIRIDVYFFDDNGNSLGSDWTNTSKKMLSGGTLEISRDYLDRPEGTTKYRVEVSDVSFE